jgi:P pilus assembly chaperone PapD
MFKGTRSIALSVIAALAFGIPSATAIEVGVSPPRFELEMNGKRSSQSISITNLSDQPVEMKAYVRTWTMSQNNEVQDAESTEQSLDRWIVFTPSKFTIPSRGSQTVRFAIRPKIQPKPGEHRAVLYLEEVVPETKNSDAVTTVGRLGVVIYAYAGQVKRAGTLNSVTVDTKPNALTAVFDVSSNGNGYVRMNGQYTIWPVAKYPGAKGTQLLPDLGKPGTKLPNNVLDAGVLPVLPVLPANRRLLRLPINKKLPPGNYVLDINGKLSETTIDQGIPFTIPAVTSTSKPVTSSKK